MYATESGFTAVYEVIDDASREREVASGKFAPTFDRQLRFRDVSFAFGAHQILRHANFTLNSGEIVALTGPSGAGKTTLVDLLLGLQVPRSEDHTSELQSLIRISSSVFCLNKIFFFFFFFLFFFFFFFFLF